VVGVAGGLVYAVLRGFSLWRQLKRTSASLENEAARIEDRSARIQVHLDRASGSSTRLQDASARLQLSKSRLDVQLQALREARYTVRRLLWFLPGVL
jgi:hypothetical protein